MGFGNFKIVFLVFFYIYQGNPSLCAQQKRKASKFLYDQLDYFLKDPTKEKLHRLGKLIASEENRLLTKEEILAWGIVNTNMGYYHNQFGNIPTAIMYYEKAWKVFNKNTFKEYDIIENCLQPLGNLYIKIGDLQKAENTITSYLYLSEQSQNTSKVISAITNLSITYHNQSKYQKAIEILKKGESIALKNVNILTNLATNYLDTGEIKKAKDYALQVISIDTTQVNAYQILAAIALENNDIQQGENYILKAKSQLLKNPDASARDLAKLQLAYIDILLSKSTYTEALGNIKEIYTSLLPRYSSKRGFPEKEALIADKILLKTLDVQAYIYQQLGKPILAIDIYEIAFEVNSKLNIAYPLQNTKIIQHSQNRDRTEAYIDLLYSMYKTTKKKKYIIKAFIASENSKAPFVNEALVSKQLLSQYKNDSLVIKTNQFHNELAIYDTYILKEKQKGDQANITQIQKWTSLYSNKSIELKETIKKLKRMYPSFLLKQENITIKKLQKKLKQDDLTLIEYFFGKETVYQFHITSDSIEINMIHDIENFRNVILNYIGYFEKASIIINDITGFSKSSFDTFNALKIPTTKNLLIIPDGLLNFIPFETLLIKKNSSLNFQNMAFLLKLSIVSYEISASKYIRSKNINNNNSKVLGVFPVFEDSTLELPFSLEEKHSIQEKFNGVFLEKKEATYAHFMNEVEKHHILHLSTHAEAGSFLRPASIKFRDQDILVNQLYGLQLKADLIVLSACETGIGALAKGEGPLSIARGFQYAGVQNVLFSLWKVNDKTTSLLMQYFYKNLYSSNSKTYGLHTAKLEYLNSPNISNIQKSPYYWAAFVYYGAYTPSVEPKSIWSIIIGSFLLIVLFLFVIRQKRK